MDDEIAHPTEDPIQWWLKRKGTYPTLWKMAVDLLGIPATSAPSERIFSKAGEVFRKRQKRLNGNAAQALLNVGSWWGGDILPGVDAPILKHPRIDHLRRNFIKMPLAIKTENGGWRVTMKESQEENLIETEQDRIQIEQELEKSGIHEDDLLDNWDDFV